MIIYGKISQIIDYTIGLPIWVGEEWFRKTFERESHLSYLFIVNKTLEDKIVPPEEEIRKVLENTVYSHANTLTTIVPGGLVGAAMGALLARLTDLPPHLLIGIGGLYGVSGSLYGYIDAYKRNKKNIEDLVRKTRGLVTERLKSIDVYIQ